MSLVLCDRKDKVMGCSSYSILETFDWKECQKIICLWSTGVSHVQHYTIWTQPVSATWPKSHNAVPHLVMDLTATCHLHCLATFIVIPRCSCYQGTPRLPAKTLCLALDTSHAVQEIKTCTTSQPSSRREKKILLHSPGLTPTGRSRAHHRGAQQIAVLCVWPTFSLPVSSEELGGCGDTWKWVMHQWENESPPKLWQTTSEVLQVCSGEVLYWRGWDSCLFMLSFPAPPEEITINSI